MDGIGAAWAVDVGLGALQEFPAPRRIHRSVDRGGGNIVGAGGQWVAVLPVAAARASGNGRRYCRADDKSRCGRGGGFAGGGNRAARTSAEKGFATIRFPSARYR